MKIAIISQLQRQDGDLVEFMLLRALHLLHSFTGRPDEPKQLYLVGNAGDFSPSARAAIARSVQRRGVRVELMELPAGTDSVIAGEFSEAIGGPLPEFNRPPYPFLLADCDEPGTTLRNVRCLELTNPELPGLTDFHVHTNFAYCSENMTIPQAAQMARLSGLHHLNFSEHSSHLYFAQEDPTHTGWYVWNRRGTPEGRLEDNRVPAYAAELQRYRELGYSAGFELDVDCNGDILLAPQDRSLAQVRVGAVHQLDHKKELEAAKAEFLFRTRSLLEFGIDILAHPFRIFAWSKLPVPSELFQPVAELLARYGVAAEINFHCNQPEPEFFRECLKRNVKLSFGSDSHNLYEVGFFHPHFAFLKEIGADPEKVLLTAPEIRKKRCRN